MEQEAVRDDAFLSLLATQPGLRRKASELAPELAIAVGVFLKDLEVLDDSIADTLRELSEQLRKATNAVLVERERAGGPLDAAGAQQVIERLEEAASGHFISLSRFHSHIRQLLELARAGELRLPEEHGELYLTLCGTSAVRARIRQARTFMEKDLSNLKKELL